MIPWKSWEGVPVTEAQRDGWAEGLLGVAGGIHRSGDSLVLARRDAESGTVEIFDCLVRRTAIVYPEER
jgi:hypothetical protein